jgi:S-DNA-T family DNA segregation ATPase FtsK/SpoIIIE
MAVVGNLQDPRKEVLPQRDLFPTRICLRLPDHALVDRVLTDGAHDRGARAEDIPDHLPGVGYVLLDGQRQPTRVRASWWSDDDIARTVERYTRRPLPASVVRAGDVLEGVAA